MFRPGASPFDSSRIGAYFNLYILFPLRFLLFLLDYMQCSLMKTFHLCLFKGHCPLDPYSHSYNSNEVLALRYIDQALSKHLHELPSMSIIAQSTFPFVLVNGESNRRYSRRSLGAVKEPTPPRMSNIISTALIEAGTLPAYLEVFAKILGWSHCKAAD